MTYSKVVDGNSTFEEQANLENDTITYNGKLIYFGGTLLKDLKGTGWLWQGRINSALEPTEATANGVDYYTSYEHKQKFSVGGAANISEGEAFKGNFTEVRVWNHLLTEKEKTNYYDRVLNGRESGLALYWPMDEGLDRYVFDASYANDVPNGRHATVGNNISSSTIIPVDN
jgi:hypothetical protein